ncbi:hypothetical protein D3C80_1491530 [compost metagenome]
MYGDHIVVLALRAAKAVGSVTSSPVFESKLVHLFPSAIVEFKFLYSPEAVAVENSILSALYTSLPILQLKAAIKSKP